MDDADVLSSPPARRMTQSTIIESRVLIILIVVKRAGAGKGDD